MVTTVKSGEARARWRDMLDQVLSGKGDVVIERNGKRVAVLIPARDYDEVQKELESARAVREAAAVYEIKKDQAVIDSKNGTATIPLDLYTKLVAEREKRFDVIRKIQENSPDLPEEEVEKIVAEAVQKVRANHVPGGS